MTPQTHHEQYDITMLAFLTALKKQVRHLSHDDIIDRLLHYAETLPPEERAPLLQRFSLPVDTGDDSDGRDTVMPDPELLNDIEAFVQTIHSQSYVEGWDWDHHSDEMVTWGDESWADDMANLFARTDDAFTAGDFAVAASAYARLLAVFSFPEDTGEAYFPGQADPVDMVGINIQETIARYPRSLLADARQDRVPTFIDALAEMHHRFYVTVSLKAILEASSRPLADREQFLRELEPALSAKCEGVLGYGNPDWGKLLRELIQMQEGTDGLGALARRQGATVPEMYYEWILALRGEGRDDAALQAAREAVDAVQIPHAKAVLANALGTMLDERGACEEALSAKALAWHSYPSLSHLQVLLAHGHPSIADMLARIDAEYALYQQDEFQFTRVAYYENPMRILFFALAGEIDRIADELHAAPAVGWSASSHIGYSAYAVVLLSLLEPPTRPPAGSILLAFAQRIETNATSREMQSLIPASPTGKPIDLLELIIARLAENPTRTSSQPRYCTLAKQVATRRVEGIVGKLHRNAYDRAAQVALAFAEVMLLTGDAAAAVAIFHELTTRYPRHSAFRAILQTQWRMSSVLKGTKW